MDRTAEYPLYLEKTVITLASKTECHYYVTDWLDSEKEVATFVAKPSIPDIKSNDLLEIIAHREKYLKRLFNTIKEVIEIEPKVLRGSGAIYFKASKYQLQAIIDCNIDAKLFLGAK